MHMDNGCTILKANRGASNPLINEVFIAKSEIHIDGFHCVRVKVKGENKNGKKGKVR